ncbi:MAG: hypothetical protein ACI81V_000613 [Lentimonas sp.]|jgi:hypothetical protein
MRELNGIIAKAGSMAALAVSYHDGRKVDSASIPVHPA